ncbi:speedy protein A isoform X2 [Corythoichthys intestinalis]|nr:speedy protein A isoform X2 [Corythoichthys intestinalis]
MMTQIDQICPTSTTSGVTPRETSLQGKRGVTLKRSHSPPKNHRRDEMDCLRRSIPQTIFIRLEEMTSYLKLFDDHLIHNFLLMDPCCKMTDKYLLAMVFVYFKRSHLTIAEYTKKNFFIALHLANTMEEEEQESKCEIFPWALGKTWRKKFQQFLKQRDQLWARIDFRAAVSRRCCEEVMAIMPTHFVWKRERSEQHSGAHRHYEERNRVRLPRGPTASPVACAHCNRKSTFNHQLVLSSVPGSFSVQSYNSTLPVITQFNLKKIPPGATKAHGRRI